MKIFPVPTLHYLYSFCFCAFQILVFDYRQEVFSPKAGERKVVTSCSSWYRKSIDSIESFCSLSSSWDPSVAATRFNSTNNLFVYMCLLVASSILKEPSLVFRSAFTESPKDLRCFACRPTTCLLSPPSTKLETKSAVEDMDLWKDSKADSSKFGYNIT